MVKIMNKSFRILFMYFPTLSLFILVRINSIHLGVVIFGMLNSYWVSNLLQRNLNYKLQILSHSRHLYHNSNLMLL